MRFLTFAAACAVLAAPSAAFAQEAPKKDDRYDPDKVICKTKAVTGSRIARERTCMTRRQWDDQAARSQSSVEETLENARRAASAVGGT
ncbi:MAG TPA: hypothetical protein VNH53_11750 [Sphingomicrobium sp.]|jgi:hypothetical protein|nr:hypothetical protein [Sphingomicrobium sp.]